MILILAGTTLLATRPAKAGLQMVFNYTTRQYEMIDVDIDERGNVNTFNYTRGIPGYGDIDEDGDGTLYNYDGNVQMIERDSSGDIEIYGGW